MIKLKHYDDGKQKWQSHEVSIIEENFYNVQVDNMLMSREEYQNGFNNGVKQGRIEKTKECVKFFDDFAVLLNKMRFISSSKESSEYAIGYNNCIDEILELIKS